MLSSLKEKLTWSSLSREKLVQIGDGMDDADLQSDGFILAGEGDPLASDHLVPPDEPRDGPRRPIRVMDPMPRLIPQALGAFALLSGPVAAQSFTLPELNLQSAGDCRQLAARDRTSNAMIALGCLDTVAKGWTLTPTPSSSKARTRPAKSPG